MSANPSSLWKLVERGCLKTWRAGGTRVNNPRSVTPFCPRPSSTQHNRFPTAQNNHRSFSSSIPRSFFISTDTTPNIHSLIFKPSGQTVHPTAGSAQFNSAREAHASPLASAIFRVEGVQSVFFGPTFITVSKQEDANWSLLKPEIFAAIMDFYSSGQPIFREGQDTDQPQDTKILPTDSETVVMIKELLDSRIRPTIMEDGGDISFVAFDESTGTVRVQLKGSCVTCSSSTITLKNGVESMMKHYIPVVKSVVQELDEVEAQAQKAFEEFEKKFPE